DDVLNLQAGGGDGFVRINGRLIRAQAIVIQQGGGQFRVNGRGQLVIQPRLVQAPQPPQPGDPAAGNAGAGGAGAAEQILFAQPLTDRAVLATSGGRVVAVDLSDGKVAWQTRTAKVAPDRLLANDDFVVVKSPGAPGSGSQLVALDTFNGQTVFRKS